MLSDAPAHHLFCLLPPVPPSQNSLPEVLAVVQVRANLAKPKLSEGSVLLSVVADVQPLFSGFSGVSGGRNLSSVRPQQSVQREESLRRPDPLDGVGTGAARLSKPFQFSSLAPMRFTSHFNVSPPTL